jgi:chromosome segregation ATPase
MDELLQENATHSAEEISAALRSQRDRAHQFFNRWRGSNENIEQQLLAQVDNALRQISQLQEGDADTDEQWQRRQTQLVDQELRVQQLQGDLAKREARLTELQQELNRAHESLLAELRQPREVAAAATPDFSAFAAQFDQRQVQLEGLLQELAARQNAVLDAQSQLTTQHRSLDERRAALDAEAQQLHEDRQRHEVAVAQLNERAQDVDQQAHLIERHAREFNNRTQDLDRRETELAEARKTLARQLRLQRAELLLEIERRQAELDHASAAEDAELERQLGQFTDELSRVREQTHERGEQVDRLRQELENARIQLVRRDAENRELQLRLEQIANQDHHRSTETAALGAQLAEARERAESQHAAAQIALVQAREDLEQLRTELSQAHKLYDGARNHIKQLEQQAGQLHDQIAGAGDSAATQRIKELEQERDALVERLNDAEQMSSHSAGSSAEHDDLRRRFEMALDDLRAHKTRNAELEEKLAQAPRGGGGPTPAGDGKMDWESQKKRMLAQLEADFDENDPQEAKDKMTVAGAIQFTDGIVSQKDREIEELQRLLDEQSKNIGGVAIGAAAIAQLLDSDELIRTEREKIEALQNEWREKLRKAEIDISVERAKIARDRAQLEEKLQTMAARGGDVDNSSDDAGKKKKGSRWLSRLGLSEDEK